MSTFKTVIALLISLTAILFFSSCAANRAASNITFDTGKMSIADSVFNAGNYQSAKLKYQEIFESGKSSGLRALAQYKLAYLNIYYENPFANYEEALKLFKKFTKDNPKNSRVGEANNYIRILSNIESIKHAAQKDEDAAVEKTKDSIAKKHENLITNILNIKKERDQCKSNSDTLTKKIKVLESVISELENIK